MAEESLKHQTKKGLYWTFYNQLANNGLQFIVGIIMARMLSPEDYGITALPIVFFSIANAFVECGFTNAMIRKPELHEKDLTTAFIYNESMGIIFYILLFLFSPNIADFFRTPILKPMIRITALSFLWNPLVTPQNILLQRQLNFKTPAKISVFSRIIGSIIGLLMAFLGMGVWSLVAMELVSGFLIFVLTWSAVRWLPKCGWSNESFKYLWGYGNKLMASVLLVTLNQQIVPVIIGKFYSVADLGVYNRASRYAALPAQQGTGVLQKVTFPVLSKLQDNTISLAENYRKMLRASAFIIFPIMMLIAGVAKPMILLMLTDKWADSILYLQILCFSMMWYPIHSINLNLLQVKGRSDLFLRLDIIKMIIGFIAMIISLPFGLIYYVISGVFVSLISLILNTYYTGKLINIGFTSQMKDLIPIFILAFSSFIVSLLFVSLIDNLWIALLGGSCIGGLLYYIGANLFKFKELELVKYMLHKS